MTFEVAWSEFAKSGKIVTKRKSFKTEAARENFLNKLFEKDNFCELYGLREG